MKKYTIEEFKVYLSQQDSLGDIHYNLSEENVDKAIEKDKELWDSVYDREYDPEDEIFGDDAEDTLLLKDAFKHLNAKGKAAFENDINSNK